MQTAHDVSGAPTDPVQWMYVVLSPGLKRQERKFDHSLPSNVEVKCDWAYAAAHHHGLYGIYEKKSAILKICSQI
jgi:hypothetical protein